MMKFILVFLCVFAGSISCLSQSRLDLSERKYHVRSRMENIFKTDSVYMVMKWSVLGKIFNEEDESSFKVIVQEVKKGSSCESVKRLFDKCLVEEELSEREVKDICMLFACEYGDFSYLNKYGISLESGWMLYYYYQPLTDSMPVDSERWERVIVHSLLQVQLVRSNHLYETGRCTADGQSIMALLWLGRYGKSELVKNYLLNMPFAEEGWLMTMNKNAGLFGHTKNPFAAEVGPYDNVIDWYISEVIKPAELLVDFEKLLKYRACILQSIRKGSSRQGKPDVPGL